MIILIFCLVISLFSNALLGWGEEAETVVASSSNLIEALTVGRLSPELLSTQSERATHRLELLMLQKYNGKEFHNI